MDPVRANTSNQDASRQDVVAEVEVAGGEVVLVDDERALDQITKAVGDGTVRLALDGVGGAATARLASALSQHGELVGYAFMGGYAAPGDFRPLMNKDITLHSFYEGRSEYDAKIPGILREATAMIAAGTLHVPIAATYPPPLHARLLRSRAPSDRLYRWRCNR